MTAGQRRRYKAFLKTRRLERKTGLARKNRKGFVGWRGR